MSLAGFVTACSAVPETSVENTTVTDLNASDGADEVASSVPAPDGWYFSEHTDPISDERYYQADTEVVGAAHKLEVTTVCRFSTGLPSLTISGFTNAGDPAAYAYDTAIQFRGDRSAPYSLTSNNTRFNNSRVLEPDADDSDSWMPFLGRSLAIRVPFRDGDETFMLSLDDGGFRSAMAPCVARWKALRAQERRLAEAEIREVEAREEWNEQSGAIDAAHAPSDPAPLPDPGM